jgi:hypothetical protein
MQVRRRSYRREGEMQRTSLGEIGVRVDHVVAVFIVDLVVLGVGLLWEH